LIKNGFFFIFLKKKKKNFGGFYFFFNLLASQIGELFLPHPVYRMTYIKMFDDKKI